MLLGLSKGVLYLPFRKETRRSLLQIRPYDGGYEIYMALENLGPMKGVLEKDGLKLTLFMKKVSIFWKKRFQN